MDMIAKNGLAVAVQGCYWGDAEGARLRAEGLSIPGYSKTGGGRSQADEILALWSVLYTDPWYELRLLRDRPGKSNLTLGQDSPSILLRQAIDEFRPSAALRQDLLDHGLADHFEQALTALRVAPEYDQAVTTAAADSFDHRQAIARALIAYVCVAAEENEPTIDGGARDALTERLSNELHGYGMGASDFFLRHVKGLAAHTATRKLSRDRGALTDAAAPLAGDIMRFLAHGEGMRRFLRKAIDDTRSEEVFLLTHSLGGVISADLLAREKVPQVKGLITVGSQVPFLYEIGALPSLEHPNRLPAHYPAWLNIFDRRDPLSYIGAPVLGSSVVDIEVDNGQPFPQSHSAYWKNPTVWTAVTAFLR
jgi:hypothetical protein